MLPTRESCILVYNRGGEIFTESVPDSLTHLGYNSISLSRKNTYFCLLSLCFKSMHFETLGYLQTGTSRQQEAYQLLTRHQVLEKLSGYDPLLVGTIPINIDIESSDLDIICHSQDQQVFVTTLQHSFAQEKDFRIRAKEEIVVATFSLGAFEVEIFGQNLPTRQQLGYRHMLIEYQMLCERGEDFRQQVIALKRQGYKTEPAFAKLLELEGDPYQQLLRFEESDV